MCIHINNDDHLCSTESADKKTERAVEVSETAKKLLADNEEGIKQLEKDDKEARKLIDEGRSLKNQSNALYGKAKNASDEAIKAQEDGKRIAREAQEMLKTLMVCKYNICLLYTSPSPRDRG